MTESVLTVHHTHIRLTAISQLFSTLDSSPFSERDLDRDIKEFIVDWAEDCSGRGEFCLHIQSQEGFESDSLQMVEGAVHGCFDRRVREYRRKFSQLMRDGRLSLLVGLLFLGACLGLAKILEPLTAHSRLLVLVSESLFIAGWVAMWRPMEVFLYEWWPLLRKRRIYQRLARMRVVLESPENCKGK